MSIEASQKFVGYVVLVAMFVFAIYSNVRLAIRNYELKKTVAINQEDVDELKQRNEKLKLLLTFYETSEYQEVEAKRRLGLKRPDETAILVSGLPINSLVETLEDFVYHESVPEIEPEETNLEKWLKYLRGEYRSK